MSRIADRQHQLVQERGSGQVGFVGNSTTGVVVQFGGGSTAQLQDQKVCTDKVGQKSNKASQRPYRFLTKKKYPNKRRRRHRLDSKQFWQDRPVSDTMIDKRIKEQNECVFIRVKPTYINTIRVYA